MRAKKKKRSLGVMTLALHIARWTDDHGVPSAEQSETYYYASMVDAQTRHCHTPG